MYAYVYIYIYIYVSTAPLERTATEPFEVKPRPRSYLRIMGWVFDESSAGMQNNQAKRRCYHICPYLALGMGV